MHSFDYLFNFDSDSKYNLSPLNSGLPLKTNFLPEMPGAEIRTIAWCVLVFLMLLPAMATSASDSSKYQIVNVLDQEWLVYNKKFSAYVYYLSDIHKKVHTVNQWLEVEKYKNYQLSFESEPGLTLFINNRLVYKNCTPQRRRVFFKISDFVSFESDGRVLLTFYNPSFQLPLHTTCILCKTLAEPSHHNSLALLTNKRKYSNELSIYSVLFLLILGLMAFLKHRYTKRYNEFMGLTNILPGAMLEESTMLKINSIPLLVILLINSLGLSLLTGLCGGLPALLNIFGFSQSGGRSLTYMLGTSTCIYFCIFLLKYWFLLFIGWVFNLSEVIKIQFFELIKGLLKATVAMVLISLVWYGVKETPSSPVFHFASYMVVTAIAITSLRTAYIIFKLSPFRNIYLFSYLCTTEIMPLAIIIKIILFWNN